MESVWILVPVSLVLVLVIVAVLVWAVQSGQFDRLDEVGHTDEEASTPAGD